MNFLGVVTSEAVRGVFGVRSNELSDEVFVFTNFEIELQMRTEDWLPETIAEVCAKAAAQTAGYDTKLKLLKLYSQYAGAMIMSPHARLGFAETLSDGQNEFSRNSKALDKLLVETASREGSYKEDLLLSYEEILAERTALFGSASPDYDPVTNETA